jgi:hypothetical protein
MIDHPATRTAERPAPRWLRPAPRLLAAGRHPDRLPRRAAQREAPGIARGLSPDSAGSAKASEGSAAYIDSVHSLGVKPVVTDWPNFGPLLRIRRYRPVFTFWNVSVLLVVNT